MVLIRLLCELSMCKILRKVRQKKILIYASVSQNVKEPYW